MSTAAIILLLSFHLGWGETGLLLGAAIVLFDGAARRKVIDGRLLGIGALLHIIARIIVQQMDPEGDAFGVFNPLSGLIMPVAVVLYFRRQRNRFEGEVVLRTRELREEKQRSDDLLLNILPSDVAEELKAKGHAEAKHFEQVTILFTDFKGFTEASEKLSPQELVEELNTCFMAFDHIITARGIEKIKTIGDAYMCAGGLPDPKTSSPEDVVRAGLEMQAFMIDRKKERDAAGLFSFEMRVGIHTGPVVAGIVGVKKFQYDIWGDTVNTASRMESSGEVGQVNISGATYALVVEQASRLFTFTPRGKVQAKGKGEMEMYFVTLFGTPFRLV
ncbi:MAG: hypothetical protein IPP83_09175 [Flavobacteriales bacterium]|nr:hypothetical protein [Flavobacteriales bacterium]